MRKISININKKLFYGFLIVLALIYLIPVYMAFITSLKNPSEINLLTSWAFPKHINFGGFTQAFSLLKTDVSNSLILAFSATIISAFIGSINGYVFSKNKFKGSEIVFTLLLFGMFIPYQIILIPLFQLLKSIGLYGSLTGLILAHVIYGIPIVTLIFRNFYDQISDSIMESGRLDGADYFDLYFRLILPLSMPGFVVDGTNFSGE